jgi:hypothetical protein
MIFFDDDLSSVDMFDGADEFSSFVKRKRLHTLAEATVSKEQERANKTKRKIKPTNILGTNVALKIGSTCMRQRVTLINRIMLCS